MKKISVYLATFFVCATVLGLNLAYAQTQATGGKHNSRNEQRAEFRFDNLVAQARPMRRAGFSLIPASNKGNTGASGFTMMPLGASLSPIGGNAVDVPAMIETTLGGLKFPNGTLQQPASAKSAPLFSVAHDEPLQGDGTSGSPLGITVPLTLSGSLTVNGNIRANTISSGNSFVSGLLDVGSLIRAHTISGNAVEARGGDGSIDFPSGGLGVRGIGGKSDTGEAGRGLEGEGGESVSGTGGIGVGAIAGGSNSGDGGDGVLAVGGFTFGGNGGNGVAAHGGISDANPGAGVKTTGGASGLNSNGGNGVSAVGGLGRGPGHRGGIGISASGGGGFAGATNGLAASFNGDVEVTGNLSKGGGSFKIDHPLDPANKYLYHSFVESPDMMNIYNGNVTTDSNGDAFVELPQYFGA